MPSYRRAFAPGTIWFFTVNLLERRGDDLLVRHIDPLRDSVRKVRPSASVRNRCLGGIAESYALRLDVTGQLCDLPTALSVDQNLLLSWFVGERRPVPGLFPPRRAGHLVAALLGASDSG